MELMERGVRIMELRGGKKKRGQDHGTEGKKEGSGS